MGWTDTRIDELKQAWTDGFSAGQIARLLGDGLTRSAVIGKIHRLGLSDASRGGTRKRSPTTRVPKAHRFLGRPVPQAPPTIFSEGITLEGGAHVTILTVTDAMCRYGFGDPQEPDFHLCGRARRVNPITGKHNSSYCDDHSRGPAGCFRDPVAWEKAWR